MYNHIHCSECSLCRVHAATKVTNRPDKMEHLYTLLTVCHQKSTPACGSRMRVRCTCTVQCKIVMRDFVPRGNRIAGVRLRGG